MNGQGKKPSEEENKASPALPSSNSTFDLPDDERFKLRAEAQALAKKEFLEIQKKAALADMLEEEREKLSPSKEEDLVTVFIDVPACCVINRMMDTGLLVNFKEYVHGRTYEVSRGLANDINYMMARANHNERALGYPNRDPLVHNRIDARTGKATMMRAP